MSIYLLGDIHGNFKLAQQRIVQQNVQDAVIIQVGDFGVGYQSFVDELKAMDGFNAVLKQRNTFMYVIRGNHDNPAYFQGAAPRALDQSHITFVADYSVLELNQQRFLLVGGALSIDRKLHNEGEGYWQAEEFVYNETAISAQTHIDVVVTHSVPNFAPPTQFSELVYSFAEQDPELINDLQQERTLLTRMYEQLALEPSNQLTHWFYGHFHASKRARHKSTQMVLVAMNELLKFEMVG